MKPIAHMIPAALLLLAGCNKPPSAPTIHIGPYDPTTTDDLMAYIDAEASDPNRNDVITYSYTWYQDGTLRSDLTTDTVPADETTKAEAWRVIVLPNDGKEDGQAAEDEVWVVNTPPVVEVSLEPVEPLTTEDVVATPTASDDDEDTVAFTYAWTVDSAATEYSGETLPAYATTKGEVWEVTVTPTDDEEEGDAVTASVSIDNSLPVVSSVTIAPDPASEADTIEATVEASDDDGDELTYSYAWSVDGTVVQESEEATLTGELFDKHQEVLVTVTPSDGKVDGEPTDSNTITISNTPPTISSVDLNPTEVYETTTVTCVPSGWADDDGDAETYTYAWTVNGADAGVTIDTLDGASFDKGDEVACTATPCDDDECGDPVASGATTVLNTAPTLASATLSTTSPQEGDTITVALGTASDDDGDTVTFGYVWYVDGTAVANADSLTGTDFDKGDSIYVVVTPHDGEEDGAPVTSDTATAINTAPAIASVSLSPSDCYTDDTLEVSVSSSDADEDTLSFTYAWYVEGTSVGAAESTLEGALHFDKGQEVYVEVTPNDGDVDGAVGTASMVTILNSPPTAPDVSIEPEEPTEGEDDLVCVIDTDSTDADEDTVTYTFAWTVDGAAYTGGTATYETGDTVPVSDIAAEEVWTCSVAPNDGDEDGEAGEVSVVIEADCTTGELSIHEGMSMICVEAGSFTMGSPSTEVGHQSNESEHTVTLTRNYYIGVYEVTQDEFQDFMGYATSYFTSCGGGCPVEHVSWYEAAAFANAVSTEAGLAGCYSCTGSEESIICDLDSAYATPYDCEGYRLPTEAEWEYAARAGTTSALSSGGDLLSADSDGDGTDDQYDCSGNIPLDNGTYVDDIGIYCGNTSSTTQEVGLLEPNPWGLYDVHGNLYEWTYDPWDGADYTGHETDPCGSFAGSRRPLRGGYWDSYAGDLRSAKRAHSYPDNDSYWMGFRLARTAD